VIDESPELMACWDPDGALAVEGDSQPRPLQHVVRGENRSLFFGRRWVVGDSAAGISLLGVVVVVVGVAGAEVAGAEVAFSLLPHAAAVGITSTASSATITARVFMTRT